MSTIGIDLPDELRSYLQEETARRGFTDPSEFVQSLLEAERQRDLHKELETMLLEAVDGPFTDWTDADIDEIRATGIKILERRKAQ